MVSLAPIVEKLLAVAILLPIIIALWAYYSINAVLVTEIVPKDMGEIPIPKVGNRVFVYGEWVRDEGHYLIGGFYNWHEIHPVRYLKNFDSGEEGGKMPYEGEIGEGAWNKEWLIPLDQQNPFRQATGVVTEVFGNEGDGDVHIHILPDPEYSSLVRFPSSPLRFNISSLLEFFLLNFEQSVAIIAVPPLIISLLYIILSVRYPKETLLGRVVRRYIHEN